MTTPDPESASWLRIILAFTVVAGLLAGLGFVLRLLSARGFRLPPITTATTQRLQIVENLPLDVRRRLVIVRCDGREHLLLLGLNQDIVVANDIAPNQSASSDGNP